MNFYLEWCDKIKLSNISLSVQVDREVQEYESNLEDMMDEDELDSESDESCTDESD